MSDNAAASSSSAPAQPPSTASTPSTSSNDSTAEVVKAIGNILKSQSGEPVTNEKISTILLQNMATLVQQGKLTTKQILQLKEFADTHRPNPNGAQPATPMSAAAANTLKAVVNPSTATSPQPSQGAQSSSSSASSSGLKPTSSETSTNLPTLGASTVDFYPAISQTLTTTNPGPAQWAQTRPTLTGGIVGGRISGTPAQIARAPDDPAILTADDARTRRKNTPGDQSMRRTIQDLVASVDPNVKMEAEVEDLLLSIADEFIDSVTNFSCRLAKHRGSETLEVKDLQLHLERNHNIRIPGFVSDDTKISLSQSALAPSHAAASGKKNVQGQHMTLRSQRLAQVQQAKREAKLM